MSDHATQSPPITDPLADAGLRCPHCDYNLTGLPEARCPECGEAFDWEQVRKAANNPPRIYFERVRGWRKVPGFFVTWATVLFAPWVFARQAVQRVSVWHALAFGAMCFLSTLLALVLDWSGARPSTWLSTAAIYIVLQTVWLSLLDVSGWRKPFATLRFWLEMGCYTSAVMVTEFVYGPPPFDDRSLRIVLSFDVRNWSAEISSFQVPHVICAVQLLLWAAGLGCCYYARSRRAGWPKLVVLPVSILIALGTLAAYAEVFEHIGAPLYWWFD